MSMEEQTTPPDARTLVREIKAGKRKAPMFGLDLHGANLSGEDLSNMELSGANLTNTNLIGADLSHARLFKAKMNGTLLNEAKLVNAELTAADLSKANLENADLSQAGLGMAIMEEARLFSAKLDQASMTKSNLTKADLRCASVRNVRLHEAVLHGADFSEADLRSSDISHTSVNNASFRNASMRNVRLRQVAGYNTANWLGVDIRDINFAGAYLMRRFIVDQNYIAEFRTASKSNKVLYYIWWITSDCGRSMGRWCVLILVQVLVFAWLYYLVGVDPGDYPTWLTPFYFSIVTLTTLGYGDVLPNSVPAQIVAMVEVVAGYIMLGGLLAILTNKLARRAD